jgi:hypothetical protein
MAQSEREQIAKNLRTWEYIATQFEKSDHPLVDPMYLLKLTLAEGATLPDKCDEKLILLNRLASPFIPAFDGIRAMYQRNIGGRLVLLLICSTGPNDQWPQLCEAASQAIFRIEQRAEEDGEPMEVGHGVEMWFHLFYRDNSDPRFATQTGEVSLLTDASEVAAAMVDGEVSLGPPECVAEFSRLMPSIARAGAEIARDFARAWQQDTDALTSGEGTSHSRGKRRILWLAQAMLLVRDHPDWTDAAIAKAVGIDKSRLSRTPEYKRAAQEARKPRQPDGRAFFRESHRSVEAVDDSLDPNRPASRQWQDEEDLDDRIDREMRERNAKRNADR